MPEEFGGAGLGIAEAAIMMQAVAESAFSACARGYRHLRIVHVLCNDILIAHRVVCSAALLGSQCAIRSPFFKVTITSPEKCFG